MWKKCWAILEIGVYGRRVNSNGLMDIRDSNIKRSVG